MSGTPTALDASHRSASTVSIFQELAATLCTRVAVVVLLTLAAVSTVSAADFRSSVAGSRWVNRSPYRSFHHQSPYGTHYHVGYPSSPSVFDNALSDRGFDNLRDASAYYHQRSLHERLLETSSAYDSAPSDRYYYGSTLPGSRISVYGAQSPYRYGSQASYGTYEALLPRP